MKKLGFLAAGMISATSTWAETPQVTVDIAPVYGLVARVMDGVGEPHLLVPANASPHHFSMRPVDVKSLQDAAHVFILDPDLTPWITGVLENLGVEDRLSILAEVPEIALLPNRSEFAHDDHDEHEHDEHEHGGHDHDDHSHDDHAHEHAEHDHEQHNHADDAHDHQHGDHDPHSWLDPENAILWLDEIATQLSAVDPANATTYAANAIAAQTEIRALSKRISEEFAALGKVDFVVNHDAFQYFENRFGQLAQGAISFSDAADPGPAHVAELRAEMEERAVSCILVESGSNTKLAETVLAGEDTRIVELDPLGASLPLDGALYPAILASVAQGFQACKG